VTIIRKTSGRVTRLVGAAALSAFALGACSSGVTVTPTTSTWTMSELRNGNRPANQHNTTTLTTRLRRNDITDVEAIAQQIAKDAKGDNQWVEILAKIEARKWLAARYPGQYDLTQIYSPSMLAESVASTEQQWVEQEIWLDAPPNSLESVEVVRPIGELTELRVVMDAGQAWMRSDRDDQPMVPIDAQWVYYLIVVGRAGDKNEWVIHSITPIQPVGTTTTAKESTP